MRVLLLDIETAPNVVHVWGLFGQNVALNQIVSPGYTLCWAAKWLDGDEIFFDSIHRSSKAKMICGIHELLQEADAVVHYNGNSFDMPTLNAEFVQLGLMPPSPYKNIDLLKTVRDQFRFTSNKLQFVSGALGVGSKVKHEGHDLWVKCMAGNDAAWKRMERYNKGDVRLLQRAYKKIRPWIKNHPNFGVYVDGELPVCPNCGSKKLERRGFTVTTVQKYPRFQCKSCGKWSRGSGNVLPKARRDAMNRSV